MPVPAQTGWKFLPSLCVPAFSLVFGMAISSIAAAREARPNDERLASFTKAADALFDSPDFRNARWGVVLADVDSSTVLYARDFHSSFMPASNLKLFVTAASLVKLGSDFASTTTLATTGTLHTDGTLQGDLLILGTGDPSISGRYARRWLQPGTREPDDPLTATANESTTGILQSWAKALRAQGIQQIQGDVVALRSGFGTPRAGSWQLDYFDAWFAAEGSGVAINENCFDLRVHPTEPGELAHIERVHLPPHIQVSSSIVTTPRTHPEEENPGARVSFSRELNGQILRLEGTIPAGSAPVSRWGAIHDGDLFSAGLLLEALQAEGITVSGGPKTSPLTDLRDESTSLSLHNHVGATLDRICVIINKPSQNFYADQVLRQLGFFFGKEGTFREGEQIVRDYLVEAGVDSFEARTLRMVDGSGLGRQNSVTPSMTLALLLDMTRRPEYDAFLASLPVAGRDGTLRRQLRETPMEGVVHAKTGTINSVRCLSGYILQPGKPRYAFVLMANNYTGNVDKVNDTFDKFLQMVPSLDEL